MKYKGAWLPGGNVRVTVRDLNGNVTDVQEFPNLITTDGLNMVRDGLDGDVADLEVKYFAWGSNNAAPDLTDTQLGTETARKIRTSQSKPADAQYEYVQYLAPGEAVGQIEEFGWFAGALAGAPVNSGIMIARVLYSRNKTAVESITIERLDTFQEG